MGKQGQKARDQDQAFRVFLAGRVRLQIDHRAAGTRDEPDNGGLRFRRIVENGLQMPW